MLSIGACLVDDPDVTFYLELKPISDNFVPAALEISGFALDELRVRGNDPRRRCVTSPHFSVRLNRRFSLVLTRRSIGLL